MPRAVSRTYLAQLVAKAPLHFAALHSIQTILSSDFSKLMKINDIRKVCVTFETVKGLGTISNEMEYYFMTFYQMIFLHLSFTWFSDLNALFM